MAVSTYNNNNCRYRLDKLDKVVYLISEEASKNIHIDNGEAYVMDIDQEPLSLKVYNIALTDTDELDERYKFTHQLTFSMDGYANYKDFQGRYFAIVKSLDGVYWLVNPLFPCKVTYTYTLDANGSHTDFTLSTASNHPTLRIRNISHATPYNCGYKRCTFSDLKLNESIYSLKTDNHVLYTNDGFKDVVFTKNSGVFTEQFDGTNIQHDLKFDINFDDYKSSWHYNLLEFVENRYAAIVRTSCDNYILCGFGFGLNPSFNVEANDDTSMDKIHIDLIDMHDNGDFIAYEDEITIERDGTVKWVYTDKHNGYECVGNNLARYLLMEEVDALMNPTGNYKALDGYESRFPYLHIVGTFTETETFISYDCSDNCKIQASFPLEFVFNNVSCREYSLIADSDWLITSSASHITVTPSDGQAGVSYTVQVCNTLEPSATEVTSNLNITYCNRTKTYTVKVKEGDSCFPGGSILDISANAQYVTIPTSCCVRSAEDSSHQITNVSIQNSYIRVYVPQNNSGNPRQFTIAITYCDGREGEVIINQGTGFERWVKESTGCSGNYKCDVERRYTGTTPSDVNTRTDETRLSNCVISSECGGSTTRWIDSSETTCSGGKKYIVQIEQVSTDGGSSWSNTGNKRLGSETSDPSGECAGVEELEDWRENGYICNDTTKYVRLQLYVSTDGTNWIATDTYKMGDRILETNSVDCGYVIPSTGWTYEDWRLVETDYICDDGNKYEKLRRWVSNDNVNWTPTDVYKRGNLIEENSVDCGYDPSVLGNCSSYIDNGDTICDGFSKYKYLRKYVRNCDDCDNCSAEWVATQIYKRGDLIEEHSLDCGYIPQENYFEWRTEGTLCNGYDKYNRERKYISDDGNIWYQTDIYRQGSIIEANSADCGYVPPIVYEYQWIITTQTTCVSYNKYYLYKQQRKRSGSSTWEDVIPTVYSYDGNGTMTPQLIEADSADCGYVPPIEPQYKWVLLDSSQYMCDECNDIQYRWVTVNTYCSGNNLYAHQKRQFSENGEDWEDISPEETQEVIVEYNSSECGYANYKAYLNNEVVIQCNSSTTLTQSEVNSSIDYNTIETVDIGSCTKIIDVFAFSNCRSLTSVTIGSSVTSINNSAFYRCSGLTSVTIPDSVTDINRQAFQYCSGMTSVTIGNNVDFIGQSAFNYCTSLTSITVESTAPPSGGNVAFGHTNNCPIYVPCGSVDAYKASWPAYDDRIVGIPPCDEPTPSIEYRWVDSGTTCQGYDKYNLQIKQQSADGGITWTDVIPTETQLGTLIEADSEDCGYIPPTPTGSTKFSATYTDGTSFSAPCDGDIRLTSATTKTAPSQSYSNMITAVVGNCVTSIGSYAFYYCTSLTSVTIPSSVTTIGSNAFEVCTSLTSVTIPNSVTTIGDDAFYYCTRLTSLTIGNSVTTIGDNAFYICSGLTSVTIPSSVTSIGGGVFHSCYSLTSVTIGNSVTTIGGSAFYDCSGLTSVTIPNSVTSIGDNGFYRCTSLTSVTIGNSVTSIGGRAFYDCSNLTSVTIPSSVTSIGSLAFYKCRSFTSVTIPSSVTSIGKEAFYSCYGLTSITVEATTPPTLGSDVFASTNNCPIYVPSSSLDVYKAASGWSTYASRIQAMP